MKKLAVRPGHFSIVLVIILTSSVFYAHYSGIVLMTKKNSTTGCSCHGNLDKSVTVKLIGPDTVTAGQTANFKLTITGGPLVAGGTDIAAFSGTVAEVDVTMYSDQSEITHNVPLSAVAGVVTFNFSYTAPSKPGKDTLYANGNSVNFNGDSDGDLWNYAPNKIITIKAAVQGIEQNVNTGNKSFLLRQNYPNPFNPATNISFQIPTGENVLLKVYDALGNDVQTLIQEYRPAGSYNINFSGSSLPSGMYYYRLSTGSFTQTKKMILLK